MSAAINVAVIGCGTWGANHAKIYQKHPCARLVAVCDANPAKAEALARELGVAESYSDYREMFDKCACDAVSIVTPDFAHTAPLLAACEYKKHILLEKPVATKRSDLQAVCEAVAKSGVRIMADFHNRWSPPFHAAYEAIQRDELGTLQSAYMRLNDIKWVATDLLPWAAQSSVLWFLGSHTIDTLQWLFDDTIVRVYSVSTRGVLEAQGLAVNDQYLTTLEFSRGGIAQIENGWITPNGNPCVNDLRATLLGSKGMLQINASDNQLVQKITEERVQNPDVLVQHSVFGAPRGFAFESIRAFVDALVLDEEFPVSFLSSVQVSEVILAIIEAAKCREPVVIDYLAKNHARHNHR